MPQLPSGLRVFLTTEQALQAAREGNFGFKIFFGINIQDSFEAFKEVVSIGYLESQPDSSSSQTEDISGAVHIEAAYHQFPSLQLTDIGTNRCNWPAEDETFFQNWLATETTQKWLHERYDELVDLLNTTKAKVPENLKGIFDFDDDYFPPFNTGRPEQELPDSVIKIIGEIIRRDNVQSVSFPFNNTKVWRLLVNEQLNRAKNTGFPEQKAFTLTGPDSGLSCDPTVWGGVVHIPYEGACMGDLFVVPDWRNLYPDWKNEFPKSGDGKGDQATLGDYAHYMADPNSGLSCHYLLTQRDIGDLKCANRIEVGDGWILYESNRPYVKVNMSGIPSYLREA